MSPVGVLGLSDYIQCGCPRRIEGHWTHFRAVVSGRLRLALNWVVNRKRFAKVLARPGLIAGQDRGQDLPMSRYNRQHSTTLALSAANRRPFHIKGRWFAHSFTKEPRCPSRSRAIRIQLVLRQGIRVSPQGRARQIKLNTSENAFHRASIAQAAS